jgi:hypothetical protein
VKFAPRRSAPRRSARRRFAQLRFVPLRSTLRHDPRHPKLSCVVNEVLRHWKTGEKVLIFCFRINTSERLRDIITDRIRDELKARKKKCLGGEGQLKTLRARLTGRDRDLIVLGLDRML